MRSRIRHALAFGVVALVVVGVALWDRVRLVIEDREAARIKAERMLQYGLGRPLPGTPNTDQLDQRLTTQGFALGAPVFVRIFKAESELEVWLRRDGRYERFATYPICRWSGRLGPKLAQGDRQAPEGFYSVAADQLNPNSRWHRSFNVGFPNALDRYHHRTGTFLMVHGGCTSAGCYAMTDPVIDEIWRLVTAALGQGQPRFQVHIFPFRMTDRNLAVRKSNPWNLFWTDLKQGYDLFEADRVPPVAMACNGRYAFERALAGGGEATPVVAACPGGAPSEAAARLPPPPRPSAMRASMRAAAMPGRSTGGRHNAAEDVRRRAGAARRARG